MWVIKWKRRVKKISIKNTLTPRLRNQEESLEEISNDTLELESKLLEIDTKEISERDQKLKIKNLINKKIRRRLRKKEKRENKRKLKKSQRLQR